MSTPGHMSDAGDSSFELFLTPSISYPDPVTGGQRRGLEVRMQLQSLQCLDWGLKIYKVDGEMFFWDPVSPGSREAIRGLGRLPPGIEKEKPGHVGQVYQIVLTSPERSLNQPHKLDRDEGSLRSPKASGLGL